MGSEEQRSTQSAAEGSEKRRSGVSRRRFLGGAAMFGAGAAAGGLTVSLGAGTAAEAAAETVPFRGRHQAGIATPAQAQLAFAAFDVTATSRADLVALLETWTAAAQAMTLGKLVPGGSPAPQVPPSDTGEVVGVTPKKLTITIGFGPSLFDHRFGLASKRPVLLKPLPELPNDKLDASYSGGDISVQACSDNPLVCFHALRELARIARGLALLRWMQLGFSRTSAITKDQATPRNLLGFKDGTRNIRAEQTGLMNDYVWVGEESDQPWMRNGSYQVVPPGFAY